MRRRTVLRLTGVATSLGLAGCLGSPDDEAMPAATSTPEVTPTTTDSPTEPATPSASPTSSPEPTSPTMTPTGTATATPAETGTGAPDQEVVVGPGGDFSFAPESFTIAVGDTVQWTWDADNHNVRPSATPSGSGWSGTPGGDSDTYDRGYSHTHTFETAGTYEYYCAPHRSLGMTGSFTVQ